MYVCTYVCMYVCMYRLGCMLECVVYLMGETEWPQEIPQIQVELSAWKTVAHHDKLSPKI